ncbi:hypothetical protein A2U01_0105723, partial [Trifolium medium]|nr:hypothetical protein [Trifolium medium]
MQKTGFQTALCAGRGHSCVGRNNVDVLVVVQLEDAPGVAWPAWGA